MTGPMQGRLLSPDALSADDRDCWTRLARDAVEPNPFFELETVLPALEHLPHAGVSLLVVEEGGAWRACLPVQRTRVRGARRALRSWLHAYAFLGTPLLDRHVAREAARALLELGLDVAPGSRMQLEQVGWDGPAGAAIAQAIEDLDVATVTQATAERAFLRRRPELTYMDDMRRKQRSELDRKARRLEEALGGELTTVEEGTDSDALDRFLELERAGWKGREDTALASSESHAAFYRDACRELAASGRLQILSLGTPDRKVAMMTNFAAAEGLFGFKMTHDEELARFSPGSLLLRESCRVFHERPELAWLDSCAAPGSAVERLLPDRRSLATLLLRPSGVGTSLELRALEAISRLRPDSRA